jgi:hypothetical protein
VNAHGSDARGADVLVDASLNPPDAVLTVIANTAQTAAGASYSGSHAVGTPLPVLRRADGTAFVQIRDLPCSEVLVAVNHL